MNKKYKIPEPDTDSLLVYPQKGLVRLHIPIYAECILAISPYKVRDIVHIEGISYTKTDPLMYLISGRFYSHKHFKILTLNFKNQ